jgi:Ca2+-binding EF-hand superfamily protein
LLQALDLNHDGVIDASEIAKASQSLLTLDKNGDGKLTPDEYRPKPPQSGQGQQQNGQGRPPRPPGQ